MGVDLKVALDRRGYTYETIGTTERQLAIWHIEKAINHIERGGGEVPTTLLSQLINEYLGDGQQHVCCSQCGEPLLNGSSRKMALDIYHRSARPVLMLQVQGMSADEVTERLKSGADLPKELVTFLSDNSDMENAIAKSTGYRSPRLGPDSPMLNTCPGCGATLTPESVGEIEE